MWTYAFKSLAVSLGEALLGHMVIPPVFALEGLPGCFPKQPHRFTITPAVCEGSNFSPSQLTFVSIHLFDSSHLSGYEMVSHGGFFFKKLRYN